MKILGRRCRASTVPRRRACQTLERIECRLQKIVIYSKGHIRLSRSEESALIRKCRRLAGIAAPMPVCAVLGTLRAARSATETAGRAADGEVAQRKPPPVRVTTGTPGGT